MFHVNTHDLNGVKGKRNPNRSVCSLAKSPAWHFERGCLFVRIGKSICSSAVVDTSNASAVCYIL